MLWKCCTQYASKFGKLSSGHRTGKDQFSFQSQRKAMPKNAQTTTQLHSSDTLVKWCSKFSKPGFSNMWTVNFLMFKLVLEKAEEPEIKLATSAGSSKKHDCSRKPSISALLTLPKTDYVDHYRGPAPAGSRGTLRGNGIGKRDLERDRERMLQIRK